MQGTNDETNRLSLREICSAKHVNMISQVKIRYDFERVAKKEYQYYV